MRHLIRTALLAAVVLASGLGCASTPIIKPGMRTEDAERACLATFPPHIPSAVSMNVQERMFRKTYVQDHMGVRSLVIVEDVDGIVTQVDYVGYGR